jgi:hypothetical protein
LQGLGATAKAALALHHPLLPATSLRKSVDECQLFLHHLLLVNQRSLFITEINLQTQTIGVFDDSTYFFQLLSPFLHLPFPIFGSYYLVAFLTLCVLERWQPKGKRIDDE